MIKYLLWDVDGTLLDFLTAERHSLKKAFVRFGLGECTDEKCRQYSAINIKYWQRLERGEVTKEQVLIGRFEEFLALNGITHVSPREFCQMYEDGLSDVITYIDDSLELLQQLSYDYKQYIVTNGALNVQTKKLAKSGFADVVDDVFISDKIGYEKPSREFFDYVINSIGNPDPTEVLIIGDSLTSDMAGGVNYGIHTCWYNPKTLPKPDTIDYNITNLWDIKEILA
ncbi:MAG: YjjG family noncanonical pyrimidine nucleotidase [Eubacterium sp.]